MLIPSQKIDTMELLYPQRKPVGNVKIDWSHPIGKKVVFSNINNVSDLVTGEAGKLVNGAYLERGDIVLPIGNSSSGANRNALRFSDNKISGNGDISLLARVWVDSSGGAEMRLMSSKLSWGGVEGFYVSVRSSGTLYARGSGSKKASTAGGVMPMNQWVTLLVHYQGTSVTFYIDDVVSTGHTINAISTIKTAVTIGHNTGNNDSGFKGRVASLSMFKDLADRDITSLLKNPYQFLIPA